MELKDIYLFNNLGQEQLEKLKKYVSFKKYSKNQILFYEGDSADDLLILTSGVLKLFKTDSKGNEVVLNYFYPTSLIAEMPVFEKIPFPASSIFETDGEVLSIAFDKFQNEFLNDPNISINIIRSLTGKMKTLERAISRTIGVNSTERVARFLYENYELIAQMQQYKVASAMNITPETLSRIIKKFKDLGIVVSEKRKINVLKKEELVKFFNP